jgi:uncharacterized protein involved in outer membrane biogenesis
MRKLILVLAIVCLVAVAALVLLATNLNSYLQDNREWVAEQAQSVLGRSLEFGEAGISLRGGIGVRVADLRIGDDPAFSKEDFVRADAVDVRVALMPLLTGNVEVTRIVLRAPTITVIQTTKGLNLDSLGGDQAEKEPATAEEQAGGLPDFLIAVVDITDGTLRYIDKTAKPAAEQAIRKLDFRASNASRSGVDFDVRAAVMGAESQNVRIEGRVVDLEDPKVEFELTSDAFELPADGEEAAPGVLRNLVVAGKLSLPNSGPKVVATLRSPKGSVAAADYRDLAIDFEMQKQVATIQKFLLQAFGGELAMTGRYDMRRAGSPSFDLKTKLTGMRIEELIASRKSGADDRLTGELGGDLSLVGSGAGIETIKKNLKGQGSIQLVDGVLKDVNLADAALKGLTGIPGLSVGLPPSLREKYPQVFGAGDTVFENMDAKIDVRDGWANFRDFRLAARDYSLGGQGRYSLDNRLDMSTVMTMSQSLSDDLVAAAEPMRYLRNPEGRVEFPVKLIGPVPDIKPVPDVGYVAKVASRQAVGKLLEHAIGGSKQETTTDTGEVAGGGTAEDPPTAEDAAKDAATDAAADLLNKGLGGLFGK